MTTPKWLIPRRHVLRGAGAALALPVLEAMFGTEREALAGLGDPKRYLFYGCSYGYHMENFRPTGSGTDFDLTQNPWGYAGGYSSLAPLEKYKQDLVVFSGLGMEGNHTRNSGTGHEHIPFLFGTHANAAHSTPRPTRLYPGMPISTIDQLIADEIGTDTPYPSLQLGTGGAEKYWTFCWRDTGGSAATALNPMKDPKIIFDEILAGVMPGDPDPDAMRRVANRVSVLDGVLDQGKALLGRLGTADKRKLNEYLDGLRDLEKRVNEPVGPGCEAGDRPTATMEPDDWVLRFQELMDLIVLIFKCDLTRVITFMWGDDGPEGIKWYRFLPEVGSNGYHSISHLTHPYYASKRITRAHMDRFRVEQFVTLLDRLAAATEPDGRSMLETSLILFGNEEGGTHDARMPAIVLGQGNGAVTTGRHLEFDGGYLRGLRGGEFTPSPVVEARLDEAEKIGHYTDLLLAIMDTAHVSVPSYGMDQRTTPLPGLKV